MQNLRKLSVLTITFLCANYFSTLAQDEQKAFKEGDKVLSVGISGGGGSLGYSKLTPSISFDYGLKGTRGIVSLGGFLSYSSSNFPGFTNNLSSSYYYPNFGLPRDSIYTINRGGGTLNHTFTAGIRLGLHYSTRKWDLYAGALLGYQNSSTKTNDYSMEYYKGFPTSTSLPVRTEEGKGQNFSSTQFILSPYVGARYYVTKKISLNLEIGQHTGNAGIGFKF